LPDFVNAVITTDSSTLLDNFIDQMNTTLAANGMPGWSPSDADQLVIAAGILAGWAADNANVAAVVLPAVFRAFGTQLSGIPYSQGTYATASSTWAFTSPAPAGGYQIDGGTAVLIDGQAFYVQTEVDVTVGAVSANVTLVANQPGAAYNGLGGVDQPAQPNEQIDWVASVTILGPSSGGADQEDDPTYANKLANLLTLQKISVVNAADTPVALTSDICAQATGITVGRATSIDGFYPAPRLESMGGSMGPTVIACATVNTSTLVTITTPLVGQVAHIGASVTGTGIPALATVAATPAPTPSSFSLSLPATATATPSLTIGQLDGYGPTDLTCVASFGSGASAVTIATGPYLGAVPWPGANVTGAHIPANTTVAASPAPTATSFSLSNASTAAGTAETVTIDQWTQVGRAVTSFVTDVNGNALSIADMDQLAAWLATFREWNALVFVQPPSSSTIYVTFAVHVLPGYDPGTTVAGAVTALTAYLSGASWGTSGTRQANLQTWLNSGSGFNVVRFNKVMAVIEGATGVDYVPNGALTLGLAPSPAGVADLVMPGPAPLPLSDDTTILGSAV
jgi:baseplate J-like protein